MPARSHLRFKTSSALLAVTACAAFQFASAAGGYRLLQTVPVTPGDGKWDYVSVDSANRRVFCSHGDEMVVLDADTGKVVQKIPAPPGDSSTDGSKDPGRTDPFMGVHYIAIAWDPLESTCRHASLSIL